MTTKKQRRENVAVNRERFNAETRQLGQDAINGDRHRREQRQFEALRAKNKKANAEKIKQMAEVGVNSETFNAEAAE